MIGPHRCARSFALLGILAILAAGWSAPGSAQDRAAWVEGRVGRGHWIGRDFDGVEPGRVFAGRVGAALGSGWDATAGFTFSRSDLTARTGAGLDEIGLALGGRRWLPSLGPALPYAEVEAGMSRLRRRIDDAPDVQDDGVTLGVGGGLTLPIGGVLDLTTRLHLRRAWYGRPGSEGAEDELLPEPPPPSQEAWIAELSVGVSIRVWGRRGG